MAWEKEDIDKMVEWCRKGPEHAKVAGIEIFVEEYQGEYKDFLLRR